MEDTNNIIKRIETLEKAMLQEIEARLRRDRELIEKLSASIDCLTEVNNRVTRLRDSIERG